MASPVGRPGTAGPITSPAGSLIVERGDTLSSIARRNGVTLDALLRVNPDIKDPNRIQVGQRIRLPKPAPVQAAPRPQDTFEAAAAKPAVKPEAKPANGSPGWLERARQGLSSWWERLFPSWKSGPASAASQPLPVGLKRGDRGPEVSKLQDKLVALGYISVRDKLTGPGVFGPKTEEALKKFQTSKGLKAEGTLTAETGAALDKAEAALGYDKRQVAFGKHANVSPELRRKVVGISQRLGMDPDHLMAVMAFESAGTFSPSVKNKDSGATGLIQFMPGTASGIGTSVDSLAKMRAEDQLDYVEVYLSPFKGRLATLEDAYMAVLLPGAIGKPNDHVLFKQGTKAYQQNSGLDADKDGQITKAEAAGMVQAKLQEGIKLKG